MRARTRNLSLFAAAGLVFAACSEANSPVEPKAPSVTPPTVLSAAKNPRFDGYIVLLKPGASLSQARTGARLSTIAPRGLSTAAREAIVTNVLPSINGIVVRGVANASDITGNDVGDVIPNYEADIIDPVPTGFPLLLEADAGAAPTGSDQSSASFFAANYQWNYKKISANRAWVPSRGGAGARVCITDSGIDPGHQAFIGKSITSTSFFANSSAQTDTNGHGSHVAGTISTNGVGGASVAPDIALMTAKIFNGAGGGGSAGAIIAAVQWCADNNADVINMSLGFTNGIPIAGNELFIAAFQAGLDYATSRGVLIVAAAGNEGVTLPVAGRIFLPAEAAGVTSVAATAPTTNLAPFGSATWVNPGAAFDGIASYSNRGPVPSVDISAPGGDAFAGWPSQSLIISVCSRQFRSGNSFPCAAGSFFLFEAGTSMASPHVAGVAALIRGRWPSSVRSATLRNKIESCLYKSVDNVGPSAIFGRGRVNAYKATTQPC